MTKVWTCVPQSLILKISTKLVKLYLHLDCFCSCECTQCVYLVTQLRVSEWAGILLQSRVFFWCLTLFWLFVRSLQGFHQTVWKTERAESPPPRWVCSVSVEMLRWRLWTRGAGSRTRTHQTAVHLVSGSRLGLRRGQLAHLSCIRFPFSAAFYCCCTAFIWATFQILGVKHVIGLFVIIDQTAPQAYR